MKMGAGMFSVQLVDIHEMLFYCGIIHADTADE